MRTKEPRARHAILSYPWILPETGGCLDKMPSSEGHDACQPIGVHWVEPVLQDTHPLIAHPNALDEAQMAAQTMQLLGLS